jgi:hypothetical protein
VAAKLAAWNCVMEIIAVPVLRGVNFRPRYIPLALLLYPSQRGLLIKVDVMPGVSNWHILGCFWIYTTTWNMFKKVFFTSVKCNRGHEKFFFSLVLQPQFGLWPTSMKLSVSLRFSRS